MSAVDIFLPGHCIYQGMSDTLVVVVVEVLLYVHRNRRLIRDGGPGRPLRLSHSS